MPKIRRHHIDWSKPALPAAAEFLLDEAVRPGDLSRAIVVVPGSRAGRRLKEILVDVAEQREVPLSPPHVITVGGLPELLYPPRRPFAPELAQRLAWKAALQKFPAEDLTTAIPRLPATDDEVRWLELADVLRRQHLELAADGLEFSDVAVTTANLHQEDESQRWQVLARVQRKYLDVLDELNLWDKQTARLKAIEFGECATAKQIVLLGTVDMNLAMRQMLDQVAAKATAIVFAPASLEASFDSHGCVIPAKWENARVAIDDDHLTVADNPIDQADAVARALANFQGRFRGDQITVGLCDERVLPQVERQLEEVNVTARWGPGRTLTVSGPFRLMEAVAEYLTTETLADFAALIRHPDLESWLLDQGLRGDWLSQLDDYRAAHLQTRLTGQWYGKEAATSRLRPVHQKVAAWLAPLQAGQQELHAWAGPLRQALAEVYGHRELDPTIGADRLTQKGIEQFLTALADQQAIPKSLIPRATAAEAIHWALDAIAGNTVAPPANPEAVEMLGWLELPLDDAPALVVTSLNEGFVPKSSHSDLFLPDQLRTALGLDDNHRRYARDAYSLSLLAASRELRIVTGRRDADNNPLSPSRLLLACDDEALVRRAQLFFRPPPPIVAKRPLAGSLQASRQQPLFDVPRPVKLPEPIDSLSATDFKVYMNCPYRFYLSRLLNLQNVDDVVEELDPGNFGSLLHEALSRFGEDPRRHTTNAEEIEALLNEHLDIYLEENFGVHALAAAYVQIEQLRLRLAAFARRQAAWAEQGWRIEFTEQPGKDEFYEMDVDGVPFHIRGRIDRIDRNESTGGWAVFDYKSGDAAKTPEAAHRKKNANKQLEWIDLQLPLYRHLASLLEVDGEIQLGYITLPKDVSRVDFHPASWTNADLAAADEEAARVIRAVRAENFWPPVYPPPAYAEDWSAICMDNVLDRPALEGKQ